MEFAALNHENLKEYYGKILAGSKDLKTNACCCADDALSPVVRKALSLIDDEILSKFYGCGSPLPLLLQGSAVLDLDLGCGTGRDAYVASRLVGPDGFIIGTIPEHPHVFALDDHHLFLTGKPMLVCGNTAAMLEETRYARHFKIMGDRSVHYGLFDCAPAAVKAARGEDRSGGACC